MFIDPHVHCRDGEQSYKESIAHALSVAEKAGMTAIFDMPNVNPPTTNRELAVQRIDIAKKAQSSVFYGIHIGLSSNSDQIREAVKTFNEFKEVIGLKMFAGHSVGKIGVIDEDEQQKIYQILTEENYIGVLAVHCEKESLLKPELWDSNKPITHAYARPPKAEVESVKDQIKFAKEARFRGNLHIAHTSVPETVHLVNDEKQKGELRITCGITPHHLLLDYTALEKPEIGCIMKMNPPLREPGMNVELQKLLKNGLIDWIETDHAPHTFEEKTKEPFMSGISGIQKYPKFVQLLRKNGFSEQQIEDLTFNNIITAFGVDLTKRQCVPQENLEAEYSYDPYRGFGVLD